MIKILGIALIALSLSACDVTDLQKDTTKRLQNTTQEQLAQKSSVKAQQAFIPCETVNNYYSDRAKQQVTCEDTKVSSQSVSLLSVILLIVVNVIVFPFIFVLLSYFGSIWFDKASGSDTKRIHFLKTLYIFSLAIIFCLPLGKVPLNGKYDFPTSLAYNFIVYSIMDAMNITETSIGRYAEETDVRFPLQNVPYPTSKAHVFSPIFDHFICAISTGKTEKITYNFYRSNEGYQADSNIHTCESMVGFELDKNGNALAESLGIDANYNQKQLVEVKRVLTDTINMIKTGAINYSKNINNITLIKSSFDRETSCTNIENHNIADLDSDGLNDYKKRVSECASEKFIYETNKITGLTMEYMKDRNYLKGNVVEFCAHDYSGSTQVHTYPRKRAQEMAQACLQAACTFGDGSASGSLAQCGTALNVWNTLNSNSFSENPDFMLMSAVVTTNLPMNMDESGWVFANSFNASFEKREDTNEFASSKPTVMTIEFDIPKISGTMEYSKFLAMFSRYWDSLQSRFSSSTEAPTASSLYQLFVMGDNGFLGKDRLFGCLTHPGMYYSGWLCGSHLEEISLAGKNLIKAGFDGKLFKLVRTTNSIKSYAKDASVKASKALITKILGSKYTIFFGANWISNAESDSIYGPHTDEIKWSTEMLPLMLAVAFIPELMQFYDMVTSGMLGLGATMVYLLPALPLLYFLMAVRDMLKRLIFLLCVGYVQIAIALGNEDAVKKDFDFPDALLQFFFLLISIPGIFLGLVYADIFISVLLVNIGDFNSLMSAMTASTNSAGFGIDFIQTCVYTAFSGILIYSILKIYSLIPNTYHYIVNMMTGRNVTNESIDDAFDDEGFHKNWTAKLSGK